jgi:manganese transport protein
MLINQLPSKIKKYWSALAPSIVTTALVFGPSKMTITSKMGALFGFSLWWVIPVAVFFMMVFTQLSNHLGATQSKSLLSLIREDYGKGIAAAAGIGIFLVCISFQAGNAIGVGMALGEASNTTPAVWVILFNAVGIGLLFFRSFYKVLERLMIALVVLMLLCFLVTFILLLFYQAEVVVNPSVQTMRNTNSTISWVPKIPSGSGGLLVAFIASCFSIVGAFYQSYLVQERRRLKGEAASTVKSHTGIFLLGLMSFVVMGCAALVLHVQDLPVQNASDMAAALEPIFGKTAVWLFLTGLFGASFSSLIGNATVGGTLLGDALGWGSSVSGWKNKILIGVVMLFGTIIAITFGKLPLELIVFAQSVTIFLVPFIGILLYQLSAHYAEKTNQPLRLSIKISSTMGILLLIFLATYQAYQFLFS